LFFVSVLLDAGAGDEWSYMEPGTGFKYERSEGIAVASLYMFKSGIFSASDPKVTSRFEFHIWHGYQKLSIAIQAKDFNPLPQNSWDWDFRSPRRILWSELTLGQLY